MDLIDRSEKISILFAVNEIFPDTHGGVHTYIYEVARGLVQKGHKVFIITRKVNSSHLDTEIIDGISIHRYESKKYLFYFLDQLSSIIKIRQIFCKLCKVHKFDLINMHSPQAAMGINLSREAKSIPKIYTFYASLAEEELHSVSYKRYKWYHWQRYLKPIWFSLYLLFSRWLERKALDSSEKIISLSEFTSAYLFKTHKISKNKIVKIAAGVDTGKFILPLDKADVRNKLGLPKNNFILFTVRRLVPRMGLDNLIKAVPAILEKFSSAFLIIGGDGPLYSQLEFLIDTLKLKEKVVLLGTISDENLPLYYQASDLFILPSKALEGFGIVTLEALASGVPVLATPVGGSVEILTKLDADLLFKDISPESIASLIIKYLADSRKRTEIQQKSRQFILEKYSWDNLIRKTEKLFLDTLMVNTDK